MGGWCFNKGISTASDSECRGRLPILPAAQLILNYSYKHTGLELTVTGNLVTLGFLYRI